jgi:UDP-N-acetylglucosamine--N-acetylmuramyl-(pentapeptide) pyrophosphoryl-undecaprenol N-acetylglucosamine transferase
MNVIFTCGGTGGHIMPAISVANIWKERYPDSKILFIGAKNSMEEELVPKAGYELKTINAYGMRRGFSVKAIKRNVLAVRCVLESVPACKKIMKEFKPDVVIGTGGYASFPALFAAHQMGIPTCVHEANAVPGRTTKMAAAWADKVLVCFEECKKYYSHPERVEVVGMPVRREFIFSDREAARKELKLDDRPVVVSAFGSQGAKAMNELMAELFLLEQEAGFPFQHIHAVGSYGWSWMPELVASKGVDVTKDDNIRMMQYIYNMPTVVAAADVFIGRAGASTCNEIAASGTPCILIPSPNVTNNHQEMNARVLSDNGGASLILEKDCTAQKLFDEIKALAENKEKASAMRAALLKIAVPDSAERLCDIMFSLAQKRGK